MEINKYHAYMDRPISYSKIYKVCSNFHWVRTLTKI